MLLMVCIYSIFFFKQKTAYEMRISDWSSDVCSSDLRRGARTAKAPVLCKGRGLARTPLSGMSKAPGITGDKWRPGDRLIDERWTNTFCDQVCSLPVRLADQAEYALLALVGLRQHSGGSLRENLRLRHFGGLRGEIDVFDPRPRFGQAIGRASGRERVCG